MFEKRIKPILKYVGTIGAVITSIMYFVTIIILIVGFQTHELRQTFVFAAVNAVVVLIIMQFLKIQGISFAKDLPENKKVIEEYYCTKTKDKKNRSIKWFAITSTIQDVAWKGISLFVTTVGIIYIVIQGCNDYTLLLLAIVNLLLFTSFGLLSLNRAFEFYNNSHVPYMKEQIKNANKLKKGDIDKCLKSMEKYLETLKNK